MFVAVCHTALKHPSEVAEVGQSVLTMQRCSYLCGIKLISVIATTERHAHVSCTTHTHTMFNGSNLQLIKSEHAIEKESSFFSSNKYYRTVERGSWDHSHHSAHD